jgi:autotransporter-associated beta strand protein
MSYDTIVAGACSSNGKRGWLLGTTALGMAMTSFVLVLATSQKVSAADYDLNGINRSLPQSGSFGGFGYLNGNDNLTNSSGTLATLTEGGGAGVTYSGIISGNTAINHTSGAVMFTGVNTYTGGTTISGGVLAVQNGSALGSGGVFVTGGAALDILDGGATDIFNALTLNGTGVSDGGAVRNIAGGHVLRGAITLGAASRINSDDGQLDVNGGITALDQNLTLGGSGSGLIIVNTEIATGSGSLTVDGNVNVVLSGANTYTGATTIEQGYVQLGGGAAIADTSAVVVEAAGLLHVFDSETIGSLAGAGNIRLENAGGVTLTTGGNNASTTYSGVIDQDVGTGSLTKTGTGTFRVTGDLVYGGMTTVSAGTLRLDGWIENDVTVQSGATLSGTGQVNGAATIQSGGTLSPGSYPGMRFGSLTLNAGSTTVFDLGAPNDSGSTANDRIDVTGDLALGGTLSVNAPSAGYYRLFTYGTLTPSSFSAVTGSTLGTATVLTNVANQVNLLVAGAGQQVQFWDGADMSGNGIVGGGPGVWNAANTNWTGAFGGGAQFNDQWRASVGVFDSAAAGTVSVVGTQAFDTLQFNTTGYTLQAGAAGQLQLAGLSGTGTFNIDGSVTTTINVPIVDGTSTAMSKVGNGTLILGGANTYSGTTTISAGTLALTAGASITSDVINNSTFTTAGTITGSVTNAGTVNATGGAISGAVANDAGTFNVAGTVSSNAAFDNAGGANLVIAGTGSYRLAGLLTNAGTVTNNGAAFANVASNTGTLSNAAGATWTGNLNTSGSLINAGMMAGSLTASGGTVINNGTISGAVTMSGGTLGGNGIVGSTQINGGTLAPGNSIGTLTVQGNLAFTAASHYMVEVSPANADLVSVTGIASLGGATVNASFAPGSYVTRKYAILNAVGGVSGTFGAQVNTDLPSNFVSGLSYDANNAYLDLTLTYVPPGPVFNPLNINQANVGNALIGFFNRTGGIPLVFGALGPGGLSQVSGETGTGSQQVTFDAMNQFMGVMTDSFTAGRGGEAPGAMGYANADPRQAYAMFTKAMPQPAAFEARWSVWAAGYGGSQTTSGHATTGSNNATSRIGGIAVGADYWMAPSTVAGFALAGGGTSFGVAGGGNGHSDLFQAGAFIRHNVASTYITAAAAYGWQDITTERVLAISGIDRLRAEYNANSYSARVEGGNRFLMPWIGGVGVTPYAAVQVTAFDLPSYAETVSGGTGTFALNYASKTVTNTRTELGFRADKSFAVADAILTLRGRAAWAHDTNTDRSASATFQSLPGATFIVNGASPGPDATLTTASAEMKFASGISLGATFEGEFSDVTRSYAGKGVARYQW